MMYNMRPFIHISYAKQRFKRLYYLLDDTSDDIMLFAEYKVTNVGLGHDEVSVSTHYAWNMPEYPFEETRIVVLTLNETIC